MRTTAWVVLAMACGDGKSPSAGADSVAMDSATPPTTGTTPPTGTPSTSCTPEAGATVGLLEWANDMFDGYTLFAPLNDSDTYLIDACGRLVHRWARSSSPGNSVYLLDNGDLLRTEGVPAPAFMGGGQGGRVVRLTWEGDEVWSFEYATSDHLQHHDVELVPSGNVLVIAWERKTREEALVAGRDASLLSENELWPDTVVEIEPVSGAVVWTWHVWDHLIQDRYPAQINYGVVADHPERIHINHDLTGGRADFTHINSIAYNAGLDQILLSVHNNFNEVWVIDHSTTAAEAAGHTGGRWGKGGDLLYRWGNPDAYGRGTSGDQGLFGQHDAQWIASDLPGAGNLLVFNNGVGRGYSTVDEWASPWTGTEYTLPAADPFGPSSTAWSYEATPPEALFSDYIGGAQRLPNGNTLICNGADGHFYEVTDAGDVVWHYVNPVASGEPLTQGEDVPLQGNRPANSVFRAYRYAPDHPGLVGRDLTPGDPIELPAE